MQEQRVAEAVHRPVVVRLHKEPVVAGNDGDASAAAAPVTFTLYHGIQGLEAIRPAWDAMLAEQAARPPFFPRPTWYAVVLASLAPDAGAVHFVTAQRAGALIAVFPLQYQDLFSNWPIRPKIIGTVENDEMQLSDFVFAKTAANRELYHRFFDWLRRSSGLEWDALRLRRVPDFAALAFAADARMPDGTRVLQHDSSAWFKTSGSYDEATADMSGTFKRNLRRLSRRAEQTAPLRHESISEPEALEVAMQHFLDIEQASWKGTEGTSTAIACNPAMLSFYRNVQKLFGQTGDCVINLLWLGDVAVAGQFCLREGSKLNVLKVGYRGAFAAIAPGNLLLERIIRDCCARPDIDVLSLVNHPPWARNFKPKSVPVRSYFTPNRTLRGYLVLTALLVKRYRDQRRTATLARAQSPAKDAGGAAGGDEDEAK